jgi:predicted signal transduction protein with EAL and GGDEF domain
MLMPSAGHPGRVRGVRDGEHGYLALSSPGGTLPENLLRDADIAMHRAKVLGKDRYEVFVPELRDHASRLLQLETGLRRALERSELSLAYQPIVSLADGRLNGFEGFCRVTVSVKK